MPQTAMTDLSSPVADGVEQQTTATRFLDEHFLSPRLGGGCLFHRRLAFLVLELTVGLFFELNLPFPAHRG
jgi:hypothetical protein